MSRSSGIRCSPMRIRRELRKIVEPSRRCGFATFIDRSSFVVGSWEATMSENSVNDRLEWIRVRDELNANIKVESFEEKLRRKMSENPVVPVGTLITVGALAYGLWNCYIGDLRMSQYMMRTRVTAQGVTILATVVGFVVASRHGKV